RAVHARKPSNLNELEMFCKEEWSKRRKEDLLKLHSPRLPSTLPALVMFDLYLPSWQQWW
ncbi:hypothetical protein NFI96_032648, partial [Prochilodus magdalenae]